MQCPYCGSDTKVNNSRPSAKHPEVWRRRECKRCHTIWTTRETIDLSTSHRVVSRSGYLTPLSRDKLFVSIKDSLSHRKSALEDATGLTDTILHLVLRTAQADISVLEIIALAGPAISRFDPTAGAVYMARHKA